MFELIKILIELVEERISDRRLYVRRLKSLWKTLEECRRSFEKFSSHPKYKKFIKEGKGLSVINPDDIVELLNRQAQLTISINKVFNNLEKLEPVFELHDPVLQKELNELVVGTTSVAFGDHMMKYYFHEILSRSKLEDFERASETLREFIVNDVKTHELY